MGAKSGPGDAPHIPEVPEELLSIAKKRPRYDSISSGNEASASDTSDSDSDCGASTMSKKNKKQPLPKTRKSRISRAGSDSKPEEGLPSAVWGRKEAAGQGAGWRVVPGAHHSGRLHRPHEGEVSDSDDEVGCNDGSAAGTDDDDEEFDDGLDDDFIGDEADYARLKKMTKKEREQELFNRIVKREVLKTRFYIVKNLRFAKKRQQRKEREKDPDAKSREKDKEKSNSNYSDSSEKRAKQKLNHSQVFSSEDESDKSKVRSSSVKRGSRSRSSSPDSSGSDSWSHKYLNRSISMPCTSPPDEAGLNQSVHQLCQSQSYSCINLMDADQPVLKHILKMEPRQQAELRMLYDSPAKQKNSSFKQRRSLPSNFTPSKGGLNSTRTEGAGARGLSRVASQDTLSEEGESPHQQRSLTISTPKPAKTVQEILNLYKQPRQGGPASDGREVNSGASRGNEKNNNGINNNDGGGGEATAGASSTDQHKQMTVTQMINKYKPLAAPQELQAADHAAAGAERAALVAPDDGQRAVATPAAPVRSNGSASTNGTPVAATPTRSIKLEEYKYILRHLQFAAMAQTSSSVVAVA